MMALNAKLNKRWWLWTQSENDDGSERRIWEVMTALNAETENNDGSERQTENDDGSECQTENSDDSECQNWERRWL